MKRKFIKTDAAPRAIGPYSQAVMAGGFIYVSGQIPINPKTGELIASDIKAQTALILDNTKAILAAADCELSDVVKVTVYLRSMADFPAMNETYELYFPGKAPARATVEVSGLPKGSAVEMDFIAWKG